MFVCVQGTLKDLWKVELKDMFMWCKKKKVELPTYFMLGISMNLKTFCMCTLLVLGDSALHIPGFNQQQVESIQEENAFKLNDFRPFLVIIP